jgi:uncharacterized protein with NRDE domain
MCLIALAWGMHPDYPLVLAANRDEWYARPTAPLAQWRADSGHTIISGRDLQGGGTWMGFSPSGRFAMLTNVRKAPAGATHAANLAANPSTTPPSRGQLVVDWLCSNATAHDWAAQQTPAAYEGFNLIVGDWVSQSCHYVTNQAVQAPATQALSRGSVTGLSNAALDTPWPKTLALCATLRSGLAQLDTGQMRSPSQAGLLQRLHLALQDSTIAPDDTLPRTGVPLELEKNLSSVFVRHPRDGALTATYGTRSSLCVLLHRDGQLLLSETTHHPAGKAPSHAQLSVTWPVAAV